MYYGACLSSLPLFLCSQIITPFVNSTISPNQEGVGILAKCGILIPYSSSSVEILFNKINYVFSPPPLP